MFENMDFSKMGSMLEEAQKQAKKIQEEAEKKIFTTKAGGGMIKISVNGKSEIVDLDIDDSLLEDKESLQILLISATNEVLRMVEDDKKNQASQMLSGLGNFGK